MPKNLQKVDEMLSLIQNRLDMLENRKNNRFRTLARAKIPGILGDESLLKDLSVTGCCVECTSIIDVQPNTQYKLEIVPEGASGIGSFELSVETKWIRSGGYSSEVGFGIIASPKGKTFQRYGDYLTWRSSVPNAAGSTAAV
jgi:hypothetical protein